VNDDRRSEEDTRQGGKAPLLLPRAALGWTLLPAAKINDSQLLREFGLRAFSMHSSYNPPKCRIPK
jgi:hypothetical protein